MKFAIITNNFPSETFSPSQIEYFLKWKGFSDEVNTWEPAINLKCFELINDYEASQRLKREGKQILGLRKFEVFNEILVHSKSWKEAQV
jgi:Chromo (CHRromatin Organisation MOdifier) domain